MNMQPIKSRAVTVALIPLLLASSIFSGLRYAVSAITNPRRAMGIAYMLDQTANVAADGTPDETISARAGDAANHGKRWGCILCKILNAVQHDHCARALANWKTHTLPKV